MERLLKKLFQAGVMESLNYLKLLQIQHLTIMLVYILMQK